MGKAAEKRKARRQQYLSALAVSNPEKFREEWNKRIESWLYDVWSRAGKLRDADGYRISPAFGVVDAARESLAECQNQEVVEKALELVGVLEHEAAKAIAFRVDPRMYHMIQRREKK